MFKDPIKALKALEQGLDRQVARIIDVNATRVRDHLKTNLLAGGALHKRTKGLPVVRQKARLAGTLISAGVFIPVPWAQAHVGPPGTTTITPKKGSFLALPTDFVRQVRGHPVGPGAYQGTAIFAGIIWGKAGWGGAKTGGGLRQRRAAGQRFTKADLVPLFILKKSITIKRRLDPAALIAWIKPQFMADLRKEVLKV